MRRYIYNTSVGCQWIDVTDIEDGDYTLVLRINWDKVPDLRGFPELDYENNWAQVCINLDRSSGQLELSINEECPTYSDCLGVTFGQANMDCAGLCGGNKHYGDFNNNGAIDSMDIRMLLMELSYNDILNSPCFDLFNDGKKTIYDAALLSQCYTKRIKIAMIIPL